MNYSTYDISNIKTKINKIRSHELLNDFLNQNSPFKTFDDVLNTSFLLNREIFIGEVDFDLAGSVIALIRFWNKIDKDLDIPVEEREPIKILIDSPGGYLSAAFAIISAIEASETPIYTYNMGCAYSAGFFIFIAGHKRFSYSLASFLYHQGSTGGGDGSIDAHKFRNYADFYSKQLLILKEHTLKYSNLTEEQYKNIEKDDYWLSAEEAQAIGIVDSIIQKGDF